MKPSHLIHSLPSWPCRAVKQALRALYRNHELHGSQFVPIAQKVVRRERLSTDELCRARIALRKYGTNLSNLIKENKLQVEIGLYV